MAWRHFVLGMSSNPQSVSVEYLDLVRLTSAGLEEDIGVGSDDHNEESDDGGLVNTLVSYMLTPFTFISYLMDLWMEERVKKMLRKTQHLRRKYDRI